MRRLDFLLKTRLTLAHASIEDEISPLRIQPDECFWFVGHPEITRSSNINFRAVVLGKRDLR